MTVPRELWYLPRPRRYDKWPGGFPLHFENKLFALYGNPKLILQPFAGRAEYGIKVDISLNAEPNINADAHHLPFKDESFDFVLCEPPYNTDLSGRLYHTGIIDDKVWIREATRVTKIGGYMAIYHWLMSPRPDKTIYDKIIVVILRIRQFARICCIFKRVG